MSLPSARRDSSTSHRPTPKQSRSSHHSPPLASTAYFTHPISYVASGLYRRLTEPLSPIKTTQEPPTSFEDMHGNIYQPPNRALSPYAPPPLTGLTLHGISSTPLKSQVLSKVIAEEIRLLFPSRMQLVTDWTLAYNFENDGTSLSSLYKKCQEFYSSNHGFVLAVKDSSGGIFGAYLTEAPHPSPHYFGTGECFLWRATVIPQSSMVLNLPPPPSADTTHAQRSTTLGSPTFDTRPQISSPWTPTSPYSQSSPSPNRNGSKTPDIIRFKAFPYSGVNDYMMFCQQDYLSVGGGDGKYGLWLDGQLEKGISSQSQTFGNEPLSDEGEKFDVLNVEIWFIGN